MAQCRNCLLDLSLYPPGPDGACPNCGTKAGESQQRPNPELAPVGPGAPLYLLKRFANTLREIIFAPARFYSSRAAELVAEGGLSSALAFAVVVHWLSALFSFLWRSVVGTMMERRVNDLNEILSDVLEQGSGFAGSEQLGELRQRIIDFLFGAGAVVLAPFTSLLKLAVYAAFVHIAIRFFVKEVPGRPQSYSTTLKIVAFASAPWVLAVIPVFGSFVAWILVFITAVIGLREVYQTTTGRAVVAVVFPQLLIATFVVAALMLFLFIAFNMMRMVM